MRRTILDTDLAAGAPGSDGDAGFALALVRADRDLRLDLITTVNGNADVRSATILRGELARRPRTPRSPLVRPGRGPGRSRQAYASPRDG
ncbi:MAG: hypothetical protein ACRYG2_05070 [Janthinobacterium lividum]